MTVRHERVEVRTRATVDTVEITPKVSAAVKRSAIREGICIIAIRHTTAAIFVNENADPDVQGDLIASLARIVDENETYKHAEGNSPAHIKAILVGASASIPVRDGALDLGRWQGVYLAEFDGPRDRSASITVIGEPPQ